METELSGPGWRCLWPLACDLGEGPIWVARDQALWFVDIERPGVYRLDPLSGARFAWTPPCRIGSIAPRAGGGFITGSERGFAFVDPESDGFALLGDPEPHLSGNRFNDGKVDPAGRFWAGSMDDAKRTVTGSLYRVDADRSWTRTDDGYRITNGPAFSPDGGTMYHTDTLRRTTWAFDLAADGRISAKRVFAVWPEAFGNPDGMTVDAGGDLWIAFWGGWCVRRVAPDGTVLDEFPLPAAHVTSCAFGGADLDRLFVTTARQALDAGALAAQPLAGGLFEIDAGGARGCPPVEYAG